LDIIYGNRWGGYEFVEQIQVEVLQTGENFGEIQKIEEIWRKFWRKLEKEVLQTGEKNIFSLKYTNWRKKCVSENKMLFGELYIYFTEPREWTRIIKLI